MRTFRLVVTLAAVLAYFIALFTDNDQSLIAAVFIMTVAANAGIDVLIAEIRELRGAITEAKRIQVAP